MPSLSLAVPHSLGQEAATARLKDFIAQLKEHHRSEVETRHEHWDGQRLVFSLAAYGMAVEGVLHVEPAQVRVEMKLPLAAMIVRGKIERSIREELAERLA